jgi:Ca-activated chloride channel family protein
MHRARIATVLIAIAIGCSGGGSTTRRQSDNRNEDRDEATTGDELVPPPAVADLTGAAEAPPEAPIPADLVPLSSRMAPRHLYIPRTNGGRTSRFTFDSGQRRGWFARLPHGSQQLLTPAYAAGRVILGAGFSSSQVYAYDARTGDREWVASAPDGGPSAVIIEDGKAIYNTESCTLFVADVETGRILWSKWLGDPLMSQPAAGNGLVFSGHIVDGESPGNLTPGTTGFGVGEGRRYGFTAMSLTNGRPRWTRAISADVMSAPVLDDESVYVTTMDGNVYRFEQRTGRQLWRRNLRATSAPWLDGDQVFVTVRARNNESRRMERAVVLAKADGDLVRESDPVPAEFLRHARPDTDVQAGWAYEGSRPTIVDGRFYQTIGNEVHARDARTGELLWTRRYTDQVSTRPASPPAVAGSQLVFGTQDGVLFGLDIDTGMTTWAYEVGEPIVAQPTVAHGWVYAATTRGGVVGIEVSDVSFDGWHMWGGNAAHNGRVVGGAPPVEEDERPSEGSLRLGTAPRDGEVPGFVLRSTRVSANVSGFVTRVAVAQTFQNPYDRPVEAVYLFPLPDDAAVDAMQMRVGTRIVHAQIQRRQEARDRYERAREDGILASLLEQERANLFKQSVANIRPGDEIEVTLHYTQVLPYEEGAYRFVYPMVAGPRYEPEGEAGEGARQVVLAPGSERPDRVEVTIDADVGMALHDVTSPTHELRVRREGEQRVHVALADAARPDRDLDVRFAVAGEAPAVGLLASPPEGESAGHFSLALHPSVEVADDQIMPRELVFVVDTSSSMNGRPMELARQAMLRALEGMRETDTFRVLTFSDTTSALSDEALPATEANVRRATRFVTEMRALGATEMARGLRAALEPAGEDGRMRVVLLMTDGYIGNESEIFRTVNEHLGQARVFGFGVGSAVNRYLLRRLAETGRGDMQIVTLDESPERAADRFHERIARPFLTDLAIDWGELAVSDAYPRRLPDLYADRPLVVHARYREGASGDVVIRGRVAGRAFEQTVRVSLPARGETRPELSSVWARTRIGDLMTAMELQPNEALREEVTELGLTHHLLTEWTAFLAIDEGYRADGDAARVEQPSSLPAGMQPPPAPRAEPATRTVMTGSPSIAAPRPMRAFGSEVMDPFEGGGGYGVGGGTIERSGRSSMAPMPPAEPPANAFGGESLGDRADPMIQRNRRGPDCYALARRPDGSIDQEALEACLRNQRGSEKQQGHKDFEVAIIESQSFISGQDMDRRWLEVVNAVGYDARILPQSTLDAIENLASYDLLIVSSGVIDLAPARRAVIDAFVSSRRSVYLQGEYMPTYATNITFAEIVNAHGGRFTWGESLSDMQEPTAVRGPLSEAASTLTGYWWAATGDGSGPGLEVIHTAPNGQPIGWSFCVPHGGRVITPTDQDFILTPGPNAVPHMRSVVASLVAGC